MQSHFLQFICHGNRHSTGLQGISARAMASICVHRAPRTPLDSTPGHIDSRDGLQEARRPDTELPHTAVRARLVPCPMLSCNSSVTAIAILRASRAYPLARWHRFVSIEHREPLQTSPQGTSVRAMISRKRILSRSHNKKQKKDKPLDLSSVVAGEGLEPPASGL